ncbi:MAG: nucleoside triphosphate pyrophosphohydrolase [Acidimicrobiales bacterium]|nr:nucleoside triphosphate pyrophosphohydrolase [Acidimicrobiales bacterium]
MSTSIVVAGLGPADASLLNQLTLAAVASADHVRLRTSVHPAADVFDAPSYDHLYDTLDSFEEVYAGIVEDLVALSSTGSVVYLVPGAPTVAERTVEMLAARDDVDVQILPALSFLDLAWARLGIDPVERGVRLADAHDFDPTVSGPGALLIAQCHDAATLSDVKLAYEVAEPAEAVLLHHLGLADEQIIRVPWADIDKTVPADHLTSLFVPDAPRVGPGAAVERLDRLVRRLRTDCPWDRQQDHVSLVSHLIEETYEVVEVIDAAARGGGSDFVDAQLLREELGDLLFQVVLHSVIAEERLDFSLSEVADAIHDKLYHRHPHVFGDVQVDGLHELSLRWEQIKAVEKGREGVLDGLPALPSLPLASKVVRKVRKVGFAWSDDEGAWQKLAEEIGELRSAEPQTRLAELGDVLFAVVALAAQLDLDPDAALRQAVARFKTRFEAVEAHFAGLETPLSEASESDLLAAWRSVR